MAAMQAACKYLPMYLPDNERSWRLNEDVRWTLACRTARTKADADTPNQALPATTEHVLRACELAAKTDVNVAAILAITWLTCARTMSVVQTKADDLSVETETDGSRAITVTFRRGKSNRLGQGPHTVRTYLGVFSTFVEPLLNTKRGAGEFLFQAQSRKARTNFLVAVRDSLRNANDEQRLENRSLRRGALQALARNGANIATLLAFSGHSNVKSLKRYLNFGRVATAEQRSTKILLQALSATVTIAEASC